jgi:hypothetical protein
MGWTCSHFTDFTPLSPASYPYTGCKTSPGHLTYVTYTTQSDRPKRKGTLALTLMSYIRMKNPLDLAIEDLSCQKFGPRRCAAIHIHKAWDSSLKRGQAEVWDVYAVLKTAKSLGSFLQAVPAASLRETVTVVCTLKYTYKNTTVRNSHSYR